MLNRRTFIQSAAIGLIAGELAARSRKQQRDHGPGGASSRSRKIAEIAQSIGISRNIPFVNRPQRTLYLDVYHQTAPSSKPLPAILYFGLSGWRTDTKKFWADILGLDRLPNAPLLYLYPAVMVPQGYVVVSAECRVAREAVFPAALHDGKCALKWMRAHAKEFSIDPQRIAVMGGSASGYLAAMLAVTRPEDGFEDETCYRGISTTVQAAYCQSGMYDFVYYQRHPGDDSLAKQSMIQDFLGGSYARIPKIWRRASPINYVRPGDPPFLLMHGIQDTRVPYVQMGHFAERLKEAGVSVEAIPINHFVHGAIPGVMPEPTDDALDQIIDRFFDQHLKPAHQP